MRHAKWLAPSSRLTGRRFLMMLLWATSGAAIPAAAQDSADAPAPVLRVARDQPRLGALRFASENDTAEARQSSRRTASHPANGISEEPTRAAESGGQETGSEAARRPAEDALKLRAPADATIAAPARIAAEADRGDGWVARGSLRNRTILSDSAADADPLPVYQPILNGEEALTEPDRSAPTDDFSNDADLSNDAEEGDFRASNDRSLLQQEQNERFEADAPQADESEGQRHDASSTDDFGWIEIVPESIGAEPIPIEQAEPGWAPAPEQDALSDPETDSASDPGVPPSEPQFAPPIEAEIRRPRELGIRQRNEPEARQWSEPEASQRSEPEARQRSVPEASQRSVPAPIITAAARRLERPIEQCLQYYYQRPENARERTPWGMLHAILPYGLDATIDAGPRRYNAIAWLSGNNPCRNLRLLSVSRGGRIEARTGVGLQGHQAQLLAILAQVGVPKNYPLHVNGRRFTVSDLIESEMAACRTGQELTFTLIGLSHYLPTDSTWKASDGQPWDFERLIREELGQPVVGAACGGTHRLMGLSYALAQRRREGLPEDGQWNRAAIFINDFVDYAWRLQNRDGSFSTQWFEGREDNNDLDRKLQTSGHIMEWLVFNATEEQLQDERVDRGIAFLAGAMLSGRGNQWQVGPKGHALRAMSLYHRRVFVSDRPWIANRTASTTGTARR